MKDEVVKLAAELISCGNESDSNQRVQSKLQEVLSPLGAQHQTVDAANTSHSLSIVGSKGPLLLFVGHSDVVSTGEGTSWTHPPFSGLVEAGKLFGRGSVDMRAANAAFAVALKGVWPEIADSVRVAVAIAGDEETTSEGAPAILNLLTKGGDSVAACLVGEPSSLTHTGDRIRIGRRGSLSGTLKVEGAMAHTAYVGGRENVLHRAIEAAKMLCDIQWPMDVEPWPKVNFHVTNFRSGTGENNVVPASAEFSFNIRFGPSLNRARVIEICEEKLAAVPVPIYLTWTKGLPPYFTSDPKFPDLVADAVAIVQGIAPSRVVDGGSSDGRFFASAGIPTVELGTPARGLHEVNEALEISDLVSLVRFYQQVLREFSKRANDFS